jgi:hypothetical protein
MDIAPEMDGFAGKRYLVYIAIQADVVQVEVAGSCVYGEVLARGTVDGSRRDIAAMRIYGGIIVQDECRAIADIYYRLHRARYLQRCR